MRVKEIDRIHDRPFSEALANLRIWNAELDSLSDIKLITTHKLLKRRVGENEADRAVKMIIQGVRRAQYYGEIEEFPLALRKSKKVTLADFTQHLETLDKMEQRCFLFALDSNVDIREVSGLKWKDALRLQRQGKLGKTASKILNSSLRHLNHELVFWCYSGKKPIAMFDIDSVIQEVIDMDWSEYVEQVNLLEHRPF